MKKKPAKKKAAPKQKRLGHIIGMSGDSRKDGWQNVLAIVEQVTGGKLKP